ARDVRAGVAERSRSRPARHHSSDHRIARVPEPLGGRMLNRRSFLKGGLAGAAALALTPRMRRARGATTGQRVVVVGIGGGLRARESLGMAEGATMPNLLGTVPLISGFGTS